MKINVKIDKNINVCLNDLLDSTLLEVINLEMEDLESYEVEVELVENATDSN